MIYENVAAKLQLSPQKLEIESVQLFLRHRLRLIESQLLTMSRKYGVQTVSELDQLVRDGQIHEDDVFEEYFEFDHLEAERDIVLGLLGELA